MFETPFCRGVSLIGSGIDMAWLDCVASDVPCPSDDVIWIGGVALGGDPLLPPPVLDGAVELASAPVGAGVAASN